MAPVIISALGISAFGAGGRARIARRCHRRVEGDLSRFKEFIESRCVETGAWRGTVPPSGGAGPAPPTEAA